jgi:hypothetical protein
MANSNPPNQFEKGNQYGKLALGHPKPTARKDFKTILNDLLQAIPIDEVIERMKRLDDFQFSAMYVKLLENQRDHNEKILKLKLERERNQGGELPTNTIDIKLIDDSVIE